MLRRLVFLFKKRMFSTYKHGKRFRSNSSIDTLFPELIEIGDDFISAPGSRILAHDASLLRIGKMRAEKVVIGNNVFLGANSIILPGAVIGDNVIIGAGAIVSKTIPANSVVVGNGRILGSVDEYIEKCQQKGSSYNVSPEFLNCIQNGLPMTIEGIKTNRECVYDQMREQDGK